MGADPRAFAIAGRGCGLEPFLTQWVSDHTMVYAREDTGSRLRAGGSPAHHHHSHHDGADIPWGGGCRLRLQSSDVIDASSEGKISRWVR